MNILEFNQEAWERKWNQSVAWFSNPKGGEFPAYIREVETTGPSSEEGMNCAFTVLDYTQIERKIRTTNGYYPQYRRLESGYYLTHLGNFVYVERKMGKHWKIGVCSTNYFVKRLDGDSFAFHKELLKPEIEIFNVVDGPLNRNFLKKNGSLLYKETLVGQVGNTVVKVDHPQFIPALKSFFPQHRFA